MKKRKLGISGPELSVVGLGTWAIGGGGWKYGWGPQNDRDSAAAIRRAAELGVNWIDTAPLYGFGHAEQIVGKVLKEMREKPFIATKFGITWDNKRSISHCLKKESIKRELEASLKRLKIEAVGLYQVHWPLPEAGIEEAWECAAELVTEGKALNAGVSNFSAEQIERLGAAPRPVSLQVKYSVLDRHAEDGILPYCKNAGIGVIAYGALEKGLLTGSFSKERVNGLPMDDHRKRAPLFSGDKLRAALAAANGLKEQAERAGVSCAAFSIMKVLENEQISWVLAGMRTARQAEDCLKYLS